MDNSLSTPNGTTGSTQFAGLPGELQLLIWQFVAVANEDIVQISPRQDPTWLAEIRRPPNTPAALYVCHDSRVAALEVYRMFFIEIDNRGVYFNPDRDILDLRNMHWGSWTSNYPNIMADLRLVQSVMLQPMYIIDSPPHPWFELDSSWMRSSLRIIYATRDATVQSSEIEFHDQIGRDYLMVDWNLITPENTRRPLLLKFISREDAAAIEHYLNPKDG